MRSSSLLEILAIMLLGLAGSLKRNVAASWVAHAVTLVVGVFLMPYVVSVLGDHQYGTWVFINSIAGYSGLLYLGFGETISRYVATYQSQGDLRKVNAITTMVLGVYTAMGLVGVLIAALAAAMLGSWTHWTPAEILELRWVIVVLGLNVLFSLSGSVFGGVLLGLRRFDLERSVSLVSDLVRLALIVFFLNREWGLLTISLIYLGITIAENTVFAWMAFRCLPELRIDPRLVSRETLSECGQFSSMAFLNVLASQLIYATDTIVIGLMLGTDAITPYYIAVRLCDFLRKPIEKIADICMPISGALQKPSQNAERQRILESAFGFTFLLIGGTTIGAVYFGGDVIRLWMGPEYVESRHLLAILLLAQVVALPCGVLRAFLFGLGHVRLPALVYLAEAITNLALSIVLCHYWGIWGVAIGTAVPIFVFELGLLVPYSLRLLEVPPSRLWRNAIRPQLLPLALLWSYSLNVGTQPWSHAGWAMLVIVSALGGSVLVGTWMATRRLLPA
ncbi:MAG: polysaccharide biosynthesis C-terminal domain-containing protein [Planctomycetaceae bacterium]|nr:polysaccharide biosynthesis C-terminal domain-containing protein [Planctomycetaceae bacterium]